MSLTSIGLSPELGEYVVSHTTPRDELLLKIERETAALGELAVMQTAPEQAALLELLVRVTGSRRALEVGTFTGYGAVRIARGLAADGTLLCLELEQRWADVAAANLRADGMAERVEIRVGPALEALRALPAEPQFDFAYLDADKGGYPGYYEELVPRLAAGGLLAIDNVLAAGRVLDPGDDENVRAVCELNDRIAADDRVEAVMVPIGDGMTLVRRRSGKRS